MKYIQYGASTCCFSSLNAVIFVSREFVVEHVISALTKSLLVFQSNGYVDRIIFAENIMVD